MSSHRSPAAAPSRSLAVIIVSFNCREMLSTCLRSIESQHGVDLRVVVVDNNSVDATVDMVRRDHPRVKVIANQENVGFGRACNQALPHAQDGDVLMLNPDTVVPPGGLAAAQSALHMRPHAGLLGVKLVRADGQPDHASRREIPTPAASLAYMLGLHRLPGRARRAGYVAPGSYDDEASVGAINGAFMLARGEALAAVGGFDERFWMYGEDLDWCMRFREAGWTVVYWPGVTVVHLKGGVSGKVRSLRVNWAFHHAMWLFYQKHQARTYGTLVSTLVAVGIIVRFVGSLAVGRIRRPRRSQVRRPVGAAHGTETHDG